MNSPNQWPPNPREAQTVVGHSPGPLHHPPSHTQTKRNHRIYKIKRNHRITKILYPPPLAVSFVGILVNFPSFVRFLFSLFKLRGKCSLFIGSRVGVFFGVLPICRVGIYLRGRNLPFSRSSVFSFRRLSIGTDLSCPERGLFPPPPYPIPPHLDPGPLASLSRWRTASRQSASHQNKEGREGTTDEIFAITRNSHYRI